jgi:hypothetical protein
LKSHIIIIIPENAVYRIFSLQECHSKSAESDHSELPKLTEKRLKRYISYMLSLLFINFTDRSAPRYFGQ